MKRKKLTEAQRDLKAWQKFRAVYRTLTAGERRLHERREHQVPSAGSIKCGGGRMLRKKKLGGT
ncbi:MAG TPA: hypothetical protein VGX70_08150 [Gemmataceae bacterium]|nr:hypothetical protein [Gemmataceae bacterium]